jgi:hypothetical protein
VTIGLQGAALSDVLPVFAEIAGLPIDCSACGKVKVSGSVEDVPWDCVLQDLAGQAGLQVQVRDTSVTLEPPTSGS